MTVHQRAFDFPVPEGPCAHIDFETRAVIDLKKVGADRYAADPDTSVWCLAWAIADDPVAIWKPGDKPPLKLLDHIESGGMIAGWNIAFEVAIWRNVIARICPDWPQLVPEQLDDTMARAYARALPGSLDQCAIAVNVPQKKDKAGYRIMMKMCKPTLEWRKNPEGPPKWNDSAADLDALCNYCMQDVVVERALAKQLAPLSANERRIFLMDRAINQRGVRVDTPKVRAALTICDAEKARLNAELADLTDGHVKAATQVPLLLKWLKLHGVEMENLKKRRVSRIVRSDRLQHANDPDLLKARRALEIRLEVAKASTAKLNSMLASQDEDGRCRGLFSYHVATTGRWAGRRVQLHNFPRPVGIFDDDRTGQQTIDSCLELFADHRDAADTIRLCFDDPLPAVASCLRGLIVPEPGKKFVGGDFTGVENRMIMWLAGEEWMLEEFRKADRGEGVDNYKLTYSKSFNVPLETVTKPQRLIGKVGALACGYAGAVGAYLGMGDNYDVLPGDVARAARAAASQVAWEAAEAKYPKEENWRFGLDLETWTGIRVVVDAWRAAHPMVEQFWWQLVDCAIAAVQEKGKVFMTQTRRIKFACDGHFLFMMLPSGRCLAYARPRIVEEGKRLAVKYKGVGKKTKRWEERKLTAAILSENAASGSARDALTDAMLRLEENRYPISLHVHDEAVSEVDIGFGSADEFEAIMCNSKPWLAGCPIAAAAWEGDKFRK